MNFANSKEGMVGAPESGEWRLLQKAVGITRAYCAGGTSTFGFNYQDSPTLEYMHSLYREVHAESDPSAFIWPAVRFHNFAIALRSAVNFMESTAEIEQAEMLATQIEAAIEAHEGHTT